MAEAPEFHQLFMSVRPTRAAVLVLSQTDWQHWTLCVLEILSAAWGGAGNLFLPCAADGTLDEHLWGRR